MRIQPKSPSTLEAQTVDYFLSGEVPGTIRAVRMGEQITRLVKLTPEQVSGNEAIRATNPLAKETDLAAMSDAYINHLRTSRGEQDTLQDRTNVIASYERFRPVIEEQDFSSESKIGAGEFSSAHAIVVDGKEYVARKVRTVHDLAELEKHFKASLLVQDIEGIEHIEAISFKEGITIAPRLPGNSIQQLPSETISHINHEQLEALYRTLTEANARGVYFDTAEGNLLYDPEAGFSVLDISTKHNGMYRSASDAFAWYFMASAKAWKPNAEQSSSYGLKLYEILQTISTILEIDDVDPHTAELLEYTKTMVLGTVKRYAAFEQAVARHAAKVS